MGQLMGILWLAVGVILETGGAEIRERVDRAGGSSRALIVASWFGGLADLFLFLDFLALRVVRGGGCASWSPF